MGSNERTFPHSQGVVWSGISGQFVVEIEKVSAAGPLRGWCPFGCYLSGANGPRILEALASLPRGTSPVSYTHLTLPTKRIV